MIALRVLQREPSVPVLYRTGGFFVPIYEEVVQ